MISRQPDRPPDEATCRVIMTRFQMPAHVIRHSETVCGVALYLTRRLADQGVALDRSLILAGSLLHDITKRFSFHGPLDHALTGSKLIRRLGYPSTASVVRQHVRISPARPPGRITEAVVVNYADKRVIEDRITSLEDRIEYIRKRYGRDEAVVARIKVNAAAVFQMEKDIYARLNESPEWILTLDTEKERQTP